MPIIVWIFIHNNKCRLSTFNNEIIQITWKKGIAYRYDEALKPQGEFAYDGEGWGIATLDDELVMSDGGYEIQFRSANDFRILRKIEVKEIERNGKTSKKRPK